MTWRLDCGLHVIFAGFIAQNSTVSVPIPPAMNNSIPLRSVAGWLTILSRVDLNFPLNLYWHNYSIGFGDIMSNFWLGLENIYHLTSKGGRTYLPTRRPVKVDAHIDYE